MKESARKPFNNDAGYKCSRRFKWGWAVVYDNQNQQTGIDTETRWYVAAYNNEQENTGILDCRTKADAIDIMKYPDQADLGQHDEDIEMTDHIEKHAVIGGDTYYIADGSRVFSITRKGIKVEHGDLETHSDAQAYIEAKELAYLIGA